MASHKIKIAARVRPRLEHEIDDEGIQVAHTSGGPSCISVPNPRDVSQIFNFPYVPVMSHLSLTLDHVCCHRLSSCYDQTSTQEDIFERDVRPLIDVVYSGVVRVSFIENDLISHSTYCLQTVTIFAYGVTSSGKTHTMQGTKAQPGVIPRVVEVCLHTCSRFLHA